ncbi:MAG: SDR family oxidoreductase [Hyphomicrobiales bacterium]|jgi:NAD(P)-dependent dehydrogenase (short-subunit alcohol dehydrogenase family)
MFNLTPIPVPDLSGRTILLTGADRGIGAALTRILVDKGANVIAGIYGKVDGPEMLEGARTISLDVTSQSQVDDAIQEVGGQLDVLVNNAGVIAPIGHAADLATDSMRQAFEVNVLGVHRMVVAALPLLKASKGRIVNAGTGAATTPMEGWTAYCSSKAAMRMLTQMFAMELESDGVRSVFIGIPPTDTDMQGSIRQAGLNPISKIAQSDLVDPRVPASVMAWLCSEQAAQRTDVIQDVRDEFFTEQMAL